VKKFSVEVFGIKDQIAGGGCDCGGVCGPQKNYGRYIRGQYKLLLI